MIGGLIIRGKLSMRLKSKQDWGQHLLLMGVGPLLDKVFV